MKLFSIAVFLLLCMETYAQEKFNNVYYDPYGNASVSMVEHNGSYYVLTVTGEEYSNQYIGIHKVDSLGELSNSITAGVENTYIFGGFNNLYKSNYCDSLLSCGDLVNTTDYCHTVYISFTNLQLNEIRIIPINVDSVFSAYDIVEVNDSLYAMATQGLNPDSFAGFILYDKKNDTVIINKEYNISGVETNGLFGSILKTMDHGLLFGGYTSAFGTGSYKKDWLLIKTDSLGNENWIRYYGNPSENDGRIMAMLEAQDSTYVLAGGQAICNWSMDPILEACLRKVDTVGNLVWERFYRRYDLDNDANLMRYSSMYISDVIELENGSLVATLNYKRADGDGGAYRFRIVKFSPSGEILFSRTMQNTNIVYTQSLFSSSIKQTTDNGFIINGYGDYMWDYDPTQQFWLIKTDSLGCEGELYTTPPTENVECPGLPDTLYCEGHYPTKLRVQGKTAPYTLEFSTGEIIENLFYPPVFIPKSQGTGSFTVHVGVNTYNHSYDSATLYNPTPAEDMEPDIIELPFSLNIPENYFGPDLTVTITNGFGESYEITLPVYVDCNVSSEQITESANINIYPNPASDFLQISLPQFEENSFVKIINAQGQSVLMEQLFNAETKLDINALPAGSYIARIYCGNKIENLRFAKE